MLILLNSEHLKWPSRRENLKDIYTSKSQLQKRNRKPKC
jgi:hypothetical protein